MAKVSIVEAIAAELRARPTGNKPWWLRVKPEHVATLEEIKAAWRSGKLGTKKLPAAKLIAKALNDGGIASVGHNGVISWLDENRR